MKTYKRQKEVLEYFENKNYGLSKSHKMNNARYKVYQVFDNHIFNRSDDIPFSTDALIGDLTIVKKDLNYILMVLRREAESRYKTALKRKSRFLFKPDRRRGWETYGLKDDEKAKNDLIYVSDRWLCEFRIQWILDLIEYRKSKNLLTPNYPIVH